MDPPIVAQLPSLVHLLATWTSPAVDLGTRVVDLMKTMAQEILIGQAYVDLTEQWIRDLESVEYETRLEAFKDVLLNANFNWPFYNITPAFFNIYKPYFHNTAFYGPC
ncbi:hypothetical protein CPB97_001005 [Podila verticillata]|nr:hypothetical protein CPB97_001005 [Podila verticillata]